MMPPNPDTELSPDEIRALELFTRSCRESIVKMVTKAQSGHPGGSLSSLDYLALISLFRLSATNERLIVSHGHISPAVYSVLGELGVIDKIKVIDTFRTPKSHFEGHVNRQIPGVHFGTGPLGIGGSVASGVAAAIKLKESSDFTFFMMGDGECQEGQVYEMMHFAPKHKISNLIGFVDYNRVQLSDSIEEIMPIPIAAHFEAAGWHVESVDGHDFQDMWAALSRAFKSDKPSMILGHTIMGKGVNFMEASGLSYKADWHGKAPKHDESEEALKAISLNADESAFLHSFLSSLPCNIQTNSLPEEDLKIIPQAGTAKIYDTETFTDCRSAYGAALLDLAKLNPNIVALSADLSESVKTNGLKEHFPERHIECGIAEQHMLSCGAGFSIEGFVPFCSTFGAFMTSRAKDQARVNDINQTNVKMVATHCGLSVGEDGPTHQAIDDIGSFTGFFNTSIFEPADPNQCDKIIRYIASNYGNFYVRMGRAKIPIIKNSEGNAFFGENYTFKPGKADILREGKSITILAAGPMVTYALAAADELLAQNNKCRAEVICVSSFVPFDSETVLKSALKTGRLITVHDHHIDSGLAHFVNKTLATNQAQVSLKHLGVKKYQLSGTAEELYANAGLSIKHIVEAAKSLL